MDKEQLNQLIMKLVKDTAIFYRCGEDATGRYCVTEDEVINIGYNIGEIKPYRISIDDAWKQFVKSFFEYVTNKSGPIYWRMYPELKEYEEKYFIKAELFCADKEDKEMTREEWDEMMNFGLPEKTSEVPEHLSSSTEWAMPKAMTLAEILKEKYPNGYEFQDTNNTWQSPIGHMPYRYYCINTPFKAKQPSEKIEPVTMSGVECKPVDYDSTLLHLVHLKQCHMVKAMNKLTEERK